MGDCSDCAARPTGIFCPTAFCETKGRSCMNGRWIDRADWEAQNRERDAAIRAFLDEFLAPDPAARHGGAKLPAGKS
jgi:hypothetical protein